MAPAIVKPSNNLWVGNLAPQVLDSELMNLFSRYGHVDSVSSYPSRSYAFIYYRSLDDAKTALSALRGTLVRGSPLKIEFAKPAKPCKSLWVSGFGQTVTKEMLEEEFTKFGKIEDFRFIRERNTAYVDFFRLEDAVRALKNMKGKQIGENQMHVDFLRSQLIRKDQSADQRDPREGQFPSREMDHADSPLMRHESVRNYYDPTHPGPQKQQFHAFEGQRGEEPPTNILLVCYPRNIEIDEHMLHNAMILFGEIESLKSFPSRHCAFVEFRSMDEARRAKEGLQGRLFNDPRITIMYSTNELAPKIVYPEFSAKGPRPTTYNELPFQPPHMDISNAANALSGYSPSGRFHGYNDKGILGAPSWRRTSPAPEVLQSSSLGTKRHPWEVFDDQFRGDSKRSRNKVFYSFPVPSTKMDRRDLESNELYRQGSRASEDVHSSGTSQGYVDKDYIWRGLIAKGGNPVCRARCVPIGKGIESEIPEEVNCSARTGLDMLSKHYADAIGFDIVFFLPDCEEDFASYTEFLNYLGGKDRAGVARFGNGTTLFLVPPSDFLTKVLKIDGPPRLYGVVLKFPQDVPSNNSTQSQPLPTSHHMNEQARYYQDYDKASSLSHLSSPKSTPQPVAAVNSLPASQAGVTLTPELIATLSSLLPARSKSSGPLIPPLPPGQPPSHYLPASYESKEGPPQGQYNPQQQVAFHQNYITGQNMPYHPVGGVNANTHVQDPPSYMPPPGGVSRPLSGQYLSNNPQFNRQHQNEVAQSASYGFGMEQGSTSLGSYDYVHGNDIHHAQPSMLTSANKANLEILNNDQQQQTVNSLPSQETVGVEVDKNQRYQSTLQFAANLLLQIQQQQPQTGSNHAKGSANNN